MQALHVDDVIADTLADSRMLQNSTDDSVVENKLSIHLMLNDIIFCLIVNIAEDL